MPVDALSLTMAPKSYPIRSGRPQPHPRHLDLDCEVFALAAHPSERLLAAGESSGRVSTWGWPEGKYNAEESDDDEDRGSIEEEKSKWFEKKWSTRRHKGSTRCVAYSGDGGALYSAGTDSLLKAADSVTGQVTSKTWLPGIKSTHDLGPPATALLPLNPQHLIIGSDAAKIHLLDLRTNTTKNNLPSAVVSTWTPDAPIDYISFLMALPPGSTSTSGLSYHFLGAGSGYLFHMDSRRPGKVLHMSEDQEDEILCMELVPSWPGSQKSNPKNADGMLVEGKILTGFSLGVIGIWNRGDYEGHHERINVGKTTFVATKKSKKMKADAGMMGGESVDCMTVLPDSFTPLVNALDPTQKKRQAEFWGMHVAVGMGDGKVKIIRTGGNPGVVGIYEHFPISKKEKEKFERRRKLQAAGVQLNDDTWEEDGQKEAVLSLKVTSDGRLISGGGGVVTMFFGTNENKDDEDDEEGADVPSTKLTGEDSHDSDDGGRWGCGRETSDSDTETAKADKRRKKKKGKKAPRPLQRRNVVGSFSGLD